MQLQKQAFLEEFLAYFELISDVAKIVCVLDYYDLHSPEIKYAVFE